MPTGPLTVQTLTRSSSPSEDRVESRSERSDESVPEVPAETVQIVQENKSNIILQVDNAKVIASIISFTPLATTSNTTERRLRIYIDGENNRLDKVVYYTREENGDEYYSTLNYSNYGSTTVERPESIPFSLHERIRLLLYKLGLI